MTAADAPGEPEKAPEGDPGTQPYLISPEAGTKRPRVATPPFSWLGGDAWPNFPALADTPP